MVSKKRVVIVDDSTLATTTLTKMFSFHLDYEVVAIGHDGHDATRLYAMHRPDLISLDLTMPNMDGYQAILEILATHPGANILLVTAIKSDLLLASMAAGAKGYMSKPIKLNDPGYIQDFRSTAQSIFSQE